MSSGFISEAEIAEQRKVRQEEWEKVRKPDQPLEVPEEEYDHRSLFDRLQEQKQRKEFEFEEAHRLKHMIKGLDDDEIDFLDLVDRSKLEEERRKTLEEAREMADFRNKVASLQEQSLEQRIQLEIKSKPPPPSTNSGRSSQTKLLAGVVVKKRPAESKVTPPKKQKLEEKPDNVNSVEAPKKTDDKSTPPKNEKLVGKSENENSIDPTTKTDDKPEAKRERTESGELKDCTPLQCIGILPGLTSYEDSSDSASSDSEHDCSTHKFDLLGRKVCRKVGTVSTAQ